MKNKKTKLIIALVLNLSIALMELYGLIVTIKESGLSFIQYYTNDSNLLSMIISFILSVYIIRLLKTNKEIPFIVKLIKYFSVCCLTVTFLVVVFVLCPMYGIESYKFMLFGGTMLFHHFLCPVFAIISFLLFEDNKEFKFKHSLYALIPTIIYALVSMILNILKVMDGPYPFLMVYNQPVYMSIIWFIVINGAAYLIAFGLYKFYKMIQK